MKTHSQFWPLLKFELGVGRFGPIWVLAATFVGFWAFANSLPLLLVMGDSNCGGNVASLFASFDGAFSLMACWWLAMVQAFLATAFLPGVGVAVDNFGALEFLFTRAIDRRRLYRARAAALFLLVLTPLFLNLLVSPWEPQLKLGVEAFNPATAASQEARYLEAFPGSHSLAVQPPARPGPIVLRHGTETFAAWLVWSVSLGFLAMQTYCGLLARHAKPGQWRNLALQFAPMVVLLCGALCAAKIWVNPCEQTFLFFARHLVALTLGLVLLVPFVQAFCERRFADLEIL